MIDDVTDGEGFVHGVGTGGGGGLVHGALPVLLHILGGFLRLGRRAGQGGGEVAALEGVAVGLKAFTASLRASPAFTRQTDVLPFASLGAAGG